MLSAGPRPRARERLVSIPLGLPAIPGPKCRSRPQPQPRPRPQPASPRASSWTGSDGGAPPAEENSHYTTYLGTLEAPSSTRPSMTRPVRGDVCRKTRTTTHPTSTHKLELQLQPVCGLGTCESPSAHISATTLPPCLHYLHDSVLRIH